MAVDAALDGLLVAGALFPAAGAGKAAGDVLTEINPSLANNAINVVPQGNLNSSMIDELISTGVKVTPENVIDIRKLPDGRTVWLETGNASAGLQHIYIRHEVDFVNKGIAKADIKTVIMNALELNQVVGTNGSANVYKIIHDGVEQHIAIGVGSNGFVVRANPVSEWKPK